MMFAIVCALGCAVLVVAEWKHLATVRVIAKVIASLAFLAIGISAGRTDTFAVWIVVGLAFGVVGDIALLSERGFLLGLGAFLLGHTAYIVAIATRLPPAQWLTWEALVPVAVASVALVMLWPKLGKLRIPVIAYVIAIVAMVAGALALRQEQLTAGACLFFASDLSVARDKFVGASFTNKLWGLPAYYFGQILIAYSLLLK
jgi:uncharacterized membrane protein YhhN